MDKSQAEAIAKAVLAPDPKAREELLRKTAKESWWLEEKRKVAWLLLLGFVVGAVTAHYIGERFTSGGIGGAIAGGSIGWLWIGWRSYRRAA